MATEEGLVAAMEGELALARDRLKDAVEAKGILERDLAAAQRALKLAERELKMERGEVDELEGSTQVKKLQIYNRIRAKNVIAPEGDGANNFAGLSVEELAESFLALYDESVRANVRLRKQSVTNFIKKFERQVNVLNDLRSVDAEYERIRMIGRGSVAEIFLCKNKVSGRACVLKQMGRGLLQSREDSACFREELDFLKHAATSAPGGEREPGISALQHAFYDKEHCYLVFDYYAGGDLLGLLSKQEKFSEDMVRFYLSELVEAVAAVHRLGYVHRDLKIENVLINSKGHLYLGDFGSCGKLNSNGKVTTPVSGGAPEYMSPELLSAMQGDHSAAYGSECDWWSLGVIMYEMLYGETPFFAESVMGTYKNIKNFKTSLKFPDSDDEVSEEAKDLIRKLCTGQKERLNYESITKHPFFTNTQFDKLRKSRPPFVPELASPFDMAFFEDFDPEEDEGVEKITQPRLGEYQFGQQFWVLGYVYRYPYPEKDAVSSLFPSANPHSKKRLSANMENRQADKNRLSNNTVRLSFGEPVVRSDSSDSIAAVSSPLHPSTVSIQVHSPPSSNAAEQHYRSSKDLFDGIDVPVLETVTEGDSENSQSVENISPRLESERAPSPTAVHDAASTPAEVTSPTTGSRRVNFVDPILFIDACAVGDLLCVKSLVESGRVAVDYQTPLEQTGLHVAAAAGHVPIVDYLLKKNALVNAVDKDNNTPLHSAIFETHIDIAQLLINSGADLFVANVDGEMPVDMTDESAVVDAIQAKMDEMCAQNPELAKKREQLSQQFTSTLSSSDEESDDDEERKSRRAMKKIAVVPDEDNGEELPPLDDIN